MVVKLCLLNPLAWRNFSAEKKWVPDRGDIIWIDFNPQSGREMRDMQPMLVLSPMKFNERTVLLLGFP